jgi:hypothetical protein
MLKGAFHMGKDHGDARRKLNEAAQIEKEAMNMAPDKRGDHEKKIQELKKI